MQRETSGPSPGRRARTCGLASALLAASCTFVRATGEDRLGIARDELTLLIAEAERVRAAGGRPASLVARFHEVLANDLESAAWDEVVRELYARRSSATVREIRYTSLAGTAVAMVASSARRTDATAVDWVVGGVLWAPVALGLAGVDALVAPVWLGRAALLDASVSHDELAHAAADLAHARALGFDERFVEGPGDMTWPRGSSRHVDQLGYDAAWLRQQTPP